VDSDDKLCIIGTGGFGREVLCCYLDAMAVRGRSPNVRFAVSDSDFRVTSLMDIEVIPLSALEPNSYACVVAIGDPTTRQRVVNALPSTVRFGHVQHPSVVTSKWVTFGPGAILTAGTILTCNIAVGAHAHLNLHTTVGHDCEIGDYFTTAPGANVSGNCKLGQRVYVGTNAALKQGVSICDDVTIGMGAIVVKSISQPGVYVGNPLRQLS
jgi:sugar O-acyltransferase (sialic acid O-acetyltransferase NeuD family)